jgi:hypothetical protein
MFVFLFCVLVFYFVSCVFVLSCTLLLLLYILSLSYFSQARRQLPPGGHPIALYKYHISYHFSSIFLFFSYVRAHNSVPTCNSIAITLYHLSLFTVLVNVRRLGVSYAFQSTTRVIKHDGTVLIQFKNVNYCLNFIRIRTRRI